MQIEIQNLSKTYKNGVKALDNVSLTIPCGMYGLLGPNGAGKSTLMRTLATLQEPDSGSARMGDIDMLKQKDEVRKRLGYLPQDFGVYPRVSAQDMLSHIALLKGMTNSRERKAAVDAMLQRCNLYSDRKKALSGFSGGMRQRFGIAQALIGNPQLLIADEPTAGLDPGERNRFYNLLSEIGEQVIVILSTHIVEDVMDLCSKMAIIHKGRVLYEGDPDSAIARLQGKIWKRSIEKVELARYEQEFRVVSNKLVGGRPLLHVYSDQPPGDGRDTMRKFLQYEMDNYLRSRGTERLKERPLLTVEANQGYIHYRKGSVVLYYLKEMIGEEAVNRALRKVIHQYAYAAPPYPTSYALLDAFREETPPNLQYLIKDLFEDITLFSNRTLEATAQRRPDGKYDVTIKVEAHKFKADAKGNETEVPVDDWIDIGAFAKPGKGKKYGDTLYRERVHMTQRNGTYTFVTPSVPDKAGIDPFALLIDRIPDDNMKSVAVNGTGAVPVQKSDASGRHAAGGQ